MSKVRIGIVGAGWWACENHIPVLQSFPEVQIVSVCRLGREELRRVQDKFAVPFGTEDYREILDRGDLDGVVVSSPHRFHYEHAKAALQRGIHVLCEKPMVLHASEARELADLCESKKLHFVIPYGWNYTDLAAVAKEKIDAGEIGRIEHVHCHMASPLRDLFSAQGARVAENAFFKPQATTWSDPLAGGGFAHGQLTHALGLMFYITGLKAAEVFAFVGTSPTGADLFNAISCRFVNGVTGMLGGAGTVPFGSGFQLDIRLFGSEGMLLLDIERPRLEIRCNDSRHFNLEHAGQPGHYSCSEPLRVFVDLIRGKNVENRSSAVLGSRVVEVLDATFRSVRSRGPHLI